MSLFSLINFKSKPLVGLDISHNEIRLSQLNQVKNEVYLEKYAINSLDEGVIVDGKIHDEASLRNALISLADQTQTQGYPAAIAMPLGSVITKKVKLTAELSNEEHEADIISNLNHYLPGMGESYFDFAKVKKDEMLLVAIHKDQLSEYFNVINESGFCLKIVDIDLFALARTLGFFFPTQTVAALFSVNSSNAQFVVLQNKEIIFTQLLSVNELSYELKRALQLFYSTYKNLKLDSVILLGKYSAELINYIEQECLLKIELKNHLAKFFSDEKVSHRMWISCGLALRSPPRW